MRPDRLRIDQRADRQTTLPMTAASRTRSTRQGTIARLIAKLRGRRGGRHRRRARPAQPAAFGWDAYQNPAAVPPRRSGPDPLLRSSTTPAGRRSRPQLR
jgi:hypothetical protein